MVRAKMLAPPSGWSSRFTEATTAYRNPMRATASATRNGSSSSGGPAGLPEGTAQKPQALVQISPKIMNVAVPCSQHSPILGQRALSQTVCKSRVRMMRFRSWYRSPPKNFTRSHSGRGCAPGGGTAGAVELEMIWKGEAIRCDEALFYALPLHRTNCIELHRTASNCIELYTIPLGGTYASMDAFRRDPFDSTRRRRLPKRFNRFADPASAFGGNAPAP